MGEHQEARCKRVAMRMCERQAQEERLGHKSGSSKHPMIRSASRQQDEGIITKPCLYHVIDKYAIIWFITETLKIA